VDELLDSSEVVIEPVCNDCDKKPKCIACEKILTENINYSQCGMQDIYDDYGQEDLDNMGFQQLILN